MLDVDTTPLTDRPHELKNLAVSLKGSFKNYNLVTSQFISYHIKNGDTHEARKLKERRSDSIKIINSLIGAAELAVSELASQLSSSNLTPDSIQTFTNVGQERVENTARQVESRLMNLSSFAPLDYNYTMNKYTADLLNTTPSRVAFPTTTSSLDCSAAPWNPAPGVLGGSITDRPLYAPPASCTICSAPILSASYWSLPTQTMAPQPTISYTIPPLFSIMHSSNGYLSSI